MADRNLLSNLIARTSTIIFDEKTEMPDVPRLGQLWYKEGILYIYSEIDGINIWSPLNVKSKSYVHDQTSDQTQWVINHNLDDDDIIYSIYDQNNRLITSSDVTIAANTLTLDFLDAERGKCIIFAVGHTAASFGSGGADVDFYEYTQSSASSTWNINHALGVKVCQVIVTDDSDNVIIPDGITYTDDDNLVLTFNDEAITGNAKIIGI